MKINSVVFVMYLWQAFYDYVFPFLEYLLSLLFFILKKSIMFLYLYFSIWY